METARSRRQEVRWPVRKSRGKEGSNSSLNTSRVQRMLFLNTAGRRGKKRRDVDNAQCILKASVFRTIVWSTVCCLEL